MSRTGLAVRAALGATTALLLLGVVAVDGGAQSGTPTVAYDASASADGVRLRLEIPGAPLTARLVDVGAPTAQASASSLGSSRGYAALPDPGELVLSAPGLLVGLLAQGAAGLPPIVLPQLPGYPLRVATDVGGEQHAQLGEGVYQLTADSVADRASAAATGGLQAVSTGTIAGVSAETFAGVDDDGNVVASATTEVQALTVGPLYLGRVVSRATMTLDADGVPEPSSDLRIEALRIGGIAVGLDAEGLYIGETRVPLPLGDLLQSLLGAAGITIAFTEAQVFDNAVIAPTVAISMPVETGIGAATGTLSVTLGGTTAALTGPTARPPASPTTTVGDGSSGPAVTVPRPVGSSGSSGGSPRPPVTTSGSTPVASPPVAPVVTRPIAEEGPLNGLFDIRSTYLTAAGCAAAVYALAQLLRLLGVRPRWT